MARWAAFAGIVTLVTVLFLGLARLSQTYVRDSPPGLPPAHPDGSSAESVGDVATEDAPSGSAEDATADDTAGTTTADSAAPGTAEHVASDASGRADPFADAATDRSPWADPRPDPAERASHERTSLEDLSDRVVLANVALSQAIFGVVLVFGAWYARVPLEALGLADLSATALGVGVGLGVGLYLANEAGAAVADRMGIGNDERLRELLAPDSLAGWAALLGVVLPVVALFEELLFRAALVGAVPAGFGVSPWAMAVVSSVAFGFGHGAQGRTGIAVTTGLGFALAAAFVLTGSFLVVAVAHYLVNALEFVVHEAVGIG